uniref:Uncharacterized protein n=1 Tax=Glossina pallidipes TaxID=7398 RepID=A0A1B0A2Z6_GLOPL
MGIQIFVPKYIKCIYFAWFSILKASFFHICGRVQSSLKSLDLFFFFFFFNILPICPGLADGQTISNRGGTAKATCEFLTDELLQALKDGGDDDDDDEVGVDALKTGKTYSL